MIRFLCFWKKFREPIEPSHEAKAALVRAKQIRQVADTVYEARADLLQKNHFAERIRLIYEGH